MENNEIDKLEGELSKQNVYVIRERIAKCDMCGKEEDLRFGWCWDCAEAQSIIGNGRTMFEDDNGDDVEFPIKEVNRRLKMLIEKGWRKSEEVTTEPIELSPKTAPLAPKQII